MGGYMPSKPEVLKERRKNDPEYANRVREYARKYREANKEKEQKRQRKSKQESRAKDKDSHNAYMREWNAKNRDRLNREKRERRLNDSEFAAKQKIIDKKRYWKDPMKHKDARLKSLYGISIEEYFSMYERQNHKCAICDKEFELGGKMGLAVDHCHSSGKIRELLCAHCNQALGKMNDDIEILKKAIDYLMKHR